LHALQEMRLGPTKITKPLIERRSSSRPIRIGEIAEKGPF
jgi:hypothetical protein